MKHTRKVLLTGLAIIFCISLVIGAGIIFSIRNVNVKYIYYSDNAYEEEYLKTREKLNGLKGYGLLFMRDEDVREKLTDTEVLAIDSIERVFPCTVNVVIRERLETFAVAAPNGYSVYDEAGKLIKASVISDGVPLNGRDGCPDLLIETDGAIPDDETIVSIAKLCSAFKGEFGKLRRLVSSVSVAKFFESDMFVLNMYSGLSLYVGHGDEVKMMSKAYETYSSLSEEQKLSGRIIVSEGADGEPSAAYRAN